jgi:hypothetical protein
LYVTAFAFAAACSSSEPLAPIAPIPQLGLGNDPDRIRVRDQRREPFAMTVAGCSEPVVVSGMSNFIVQDQDNPADNVHFRLHTNLQGVSGVGTLSGTRYRLVQAHNATLNYVFLESPRFETNQVARFRLIGNGPDNNTWINISYHLTVTPEGRITRTAFEATARCTEDS